MLLRKFSQDVELWQDDYAFKDDCKCMAKVEDRKVISIFIIFPMMQNQCHDKHRKDNVPGFHEILKYHNIRASL